MLKFIISSQFQINLFDYTIQQLLMLFRESIVHSQTTKLEHLIPKGDFVGSLGKVVPISHVVVSYHGKDCRSKRLVEQRCTKVLNQITSSISLISIERETDFNCQ